jgi:hypothetical protein
VKILLALMITALFAAGGGFLIGQSNMKQSTVVKFGEPFYRGVHFGECAWLGEPWHSPQACATDKRRDEMGHPI